MFIFYDIETTGTSIVYDQILQFGAILADDNLAEIERFEIRCRLLPWIIPAPGALRVTETPVSQLENRLLPDFFAMMATIKERLANWGPAIFIGYNSMRFDEPFLQRAFWQALLPPYLTVTAGNSRLDLLPIIRATAYFRPSLLKIPPRGDGAPSFRLESLAPANGFNAHRAHDAMGDVEATLFLARCIARNFPELWQPLVARASKKLSAAILASGMPIFLFRHGGTPPVGFYRRIDMSGAQRSHAVLARLDYDWLDAKVRIDNFTAIETAELRRALRRVALNKAPLVFTLAEAEALAGVVPAAAELAQAQFLAGDDDYCLCLTELIAPPAHEKSANSAEVEETIFEGFASSLDERLMADFHRAEALERVMIARTFSDRRFRRLAMRIMHVTAPHLLSDGEQAQMRDGIARRLEAAREDLHPWRSIADALAELEADPGRVATDEDDAIRIWLEQRRPPVQ
jgi:exodeoxyribonuclease-1